MSTLILEASKALGKKKEARESWLKENIIPDVDAMLDLHEDSVPCVESGNELAWCDEEERHDVQ